MTVSMRQYQVVTFSICSPLDIHGFFMFTERLEADASRSRESLTPPSLNPAYKIEINHDNDDDSGDLNMNLNLKSNSATSNQNVKFINSKMLLICLISLLPKHVRPN